MTSYADRLDASLLLPSVDLRHGMHPDVRDQGPRPLCIPFAVSAAHEAALAMAPSSGVEKLAVEPLWRHCVDAGEGGHDGTTLRAIKDAISMSGQTTEAIWPYNNLLGAGTEPAPTTVGAGAFRTAVLFDVPLVHDGIEAYIEETITVGLPVVVVLELTAEFDTPSTDGEIDPPPLSAPVGDYHAVVAVGVATRSDGAVRRLLIRNSWGPGWGMGGYGWLPYDYLVAFAVQASAVDPTTLATR